MAEKKKLAYKAPSLTVYGTLTELTENMQRTGMRDPLFGEQEDGRDPFPPTP